MKATLTTLRRTTCVAAALLSGGLLALAAPAAAHHSASMFDRSKATTMKGTIKAFNWVNPHCSIIFIADGTGETWNVESTSPGVLTRSGWTKRSLNPGDKIEITLAPIRSGGPAGLSLEVRNITTGETLKRSV